MLQVPVNIKLQRFRNKRGQKKKIFGKTKRGTNLNWLLCGFNDSVVTWTRMRGVKRRAQRGTAAAQSLYTALHAGWLAVTA
jgi:hypothetical protein